MAAITEYQNVINETRRINPMIYYSGKDKLWLGIILKTDFKFRDADFFKMLDHVIKHIKDNRKWNQVINKYEYWGEYRENQTPIKYRK